MTDGSRQIIIPTKVYGQMCRATIIENQKLKITNDGVQNPKVLT